MGATSVTGTGAGITAVSRGPGNNRNQYSSLIDGHIVWQGSAALVDNVAEVALPSSIMTLPEKLSVFVSGLGIAVEKTVNADGNVSSFTLVGIG